MDQVISAEKYMTVIEAWNELQKVLNNIDLIKTKLKCRTDIKASRLKEILVQCSIVDNSQFINAIIANDNDFLKLWQYNQEKCGYELFIQNEIKRLKVSDLELCILFLKEYKKLTWEEIEKEIHYSVRKCKQVYYDYKEKAEKVWHIDENLLVK